MGVDIRRGAWVGPEQFLYKLQIACLVVDDCCSRVPERVEAGRPRFASDNETV